MAAFRPLPLALAACVSLTCCASSSNPSVTPAVEPLPLRVNPGSRIPAPPWPHASLTLYVSPQGSDIAEGSASHPFATLERARDELRVRRRQNRLPAGPVEIRVHGGAYRVWGTCVFSQGDSGTAAAPIMICAVPGEKPIFRGGTRLLGWRRLRDASEYPLVPAAARAQVWVVDLAACGITNLLPLKLGGFGSGNGFTTHPAHELFFNGQAMSLARGPNEGFLHIKQVAVKDGTKGYDREGSKVGKFFYEGERPRRWVNEPDLLLYGYWFWDWADSYERVEAIDPEQHLITLAQPWHRLGFSVGAPFYAVNALSELDVPGEWYLDRRNRRALLYPPSDPQQATIELSQLDQSMLTVEGASWVWFRGLTWELGSADAIHVRDSEHVRLAGCVVRYFAGNGVEIRGGHDDGLRSCDIYSLGRGGTIISGGDRKTLEPGGLFVENCDIHDLSRIDHTYTPAVLLEGVGNRIAHNRMHNIASSAMRVEGNDHLIEYNEIYNVVTESDDQGGVDMFGNPTYRGNVYRYNFFHHIGQWRGSGDQPKCGQAGIRLDDAICGTRIYGNVFERCSAGKLGFGGVQIHGGKDNVVANNLFLDCAAMVSCSPWDEKRWRDYVHNALDSKEISPALYRQRYPELSDLAGNVNRNYMRNNLGWHCGEMLRRAPYNLEDKNNAMLTEGQFAWVAGDIRLKAPAGFEPIPFEEIGLYHDAPDRP